MTHYLRSIILASTMVGAVSSPLHASSSSLPSLGIALCGDALVALGSIALVIQANGGHSSLSFDMQDTLGRFSVYTPLFLVPGIVLAIGGRIYMLKKAEGKMGKFRAFTAGLTSFAGSAAAIAGIIMLAYHETQVRNHSVSSYDAEQSLIGSAAGVGGGLILALSALIAP